MRRKSVTEIETALLLVGTLVLASCASTPAGAPSLPGPPSAPGPSAKPDTPAKPPKPGTAGEAAPEAGAEKAEGSTGKAAGSNPGGAQTDEERSQALDGKLDESLRELDRLLMREQETLAERRVTPESGGGGGGAAGGAGAAGGGGAADGRQGASGASGTGVGETTGDSPSAPTGAQRAPGRQEDGEREALVPPDVGDGADDDIVARQLREAALSEDDPELREKLWQEYRDYKSKRRKDDRS